MERIYMDNAATTSICAEALSAMLPCFAGCFGNASSIHSFGREAQKVLKEARKTVAACIGAQGPDIYFTSGGTESDNWALKGAALAGRERGNHIITTQVEHHAVLHTCRWLEGQGFRVTYLPVDEYGRVDPGAVEAAVTEDTVLISVMAANNEIGTVEPVAAIGRIARERGVLFHCDAVQAAGAVPVDVEAWQADLLSLSGHKFHGPKGIGALYIRSGTKVDPLLHGGAQERGRRASTANVPGAAGMAAALFRAVSGMEERGLRTLALREKLTRGILEGIPGTRLNGHPLERLPGNVHVSFEGVDAEALTLRLDLAGIAASSGSACTAGSPDPSHVLMALGRTREEAGSGLRLSLSDENTEEEVDRVLDILCRIVPQMRARQL